MKQIVILFMAVAFTASVAQDRPAAHGVASAGHPQLSPPGKRKPKCEYPHNFDKANGISVTQRSYDRFLGEYRLWSDATEKEKEYLRRLGELERLIGSGKYSENLIRTRNRLGPIVDQLNERALGKMKGQRVLDVGAGFSNFVDILNEHFDIDAVAIDIAYDAYNPTNVSKECMELFWRRHFTMDARDIQFPNGYFDRVVSFKLLNWFFFGSGDPSKERIDNGFKILDEMIRVTKAGGEVQLSPFRTPEEMKDWPTAKKNPEIMRYYQAKLNQFIERHKGYAEIEMDDPIDDGLAIIKILKRRKNLSSTTIKSK